MDQATFEEVFEREVTRARVKLVEKAKEYATGGDRLHNFKKVAAFEGETMAQALWGMQVKHLASLSDMVASDKVYSQAVWDEKLGDALNYLILLQAIVFEEAALATVITPSLVSVSLPNRPQRPTTTEED